MRQHPLRTFWTHPLFVLLLLFAVGLVGRALLREFGSNTRLRREQAKLEQEIAELQGDSRTIAAQLSAFERPFAIEYEARVKYGLRKTGEQVLIVPAAEGKGTASAEPGAPAVEPANWYTNAVAWWSYFVPR